MPEETKFERACTWSAIVLIVLMVLVAWLTH